MRLRSRVFAVISIVVVLTLLSTGIIPSTVMKDTIARSVAGGLLNSRQDDDEPGEQDNLTDLDFSRFPTFDEAGRFLETMQAKFPNVVMRTSLGITHNQHNIWALKISDNVYSENDNSIVEEPDVLYMGLHHGNEWMSAAFVLYYINYLLTAYSDPSNENHTKAQWLINSRELWFVPMLNPDAYVYNGDGTFEGKGNWRKNREPNYTPDGSTALPESAWGTDLNRNYRFHWGDDINEEDATDGRGSSFNPTSSVYRGPNDDNDDDGDSLLGIEIGDPLFGRVDLDKVDEDPMDLVDNDGDGKIDEDWDGGFSAKETIAIKGLVESHDFKISLSYHTYSELVVYPWGWTSTPCDDDWLFKKVGGVLANLTGYRLVKGNDFYRTTGDADDWLYGIHGVLAFTMELGTSADGGHHHRPELIISTSEKNILAADYVAEVANNPVGNFLHIIHEPLGDTMDFEGPYEFMARVADPERTGGVGKNVHFRDAVYLHYRLDEGPWRTELMESTGETGSYMAELAGQVRGTVIDYYIEARDKRDVNATEPDYAPYAYHTFTILSPEDPAVGTRVALVFSILFFFSVTWGSFIFCITLAIKAERRKLGGVAA